MTGVLQKLTLYEAGSYVTCPEPFEVRLSKFATRPMQDLLLKELELADYGY